MWLPCVMLNMWKWKHAELVFHAWLSLVPLSDPHSWMCVCIHLCVCVCVCVCACVCVCVCRLRWGPAETVPETDEADQARYGELWETERGVVRLYLYSFYFWKSWLLLIQDYGLILETATISSSCMWDCLSNDVLFCHMKIFCLIV